MEKMMELLAELLGNVKGDCFCCIKGIRYALIWQAINWNAMTLII